MDEEIWTKRWLSIEKRLDFAQGQIHALRSFAYAVIIAHPAGGTLGAALEIAIETAIATATPVGGILDDYLHGLNDEAANLRQVMAKTSERCTPPAKGA